MVQIEVVMKKEVRKDCWWRLGQVCCRMEAEWRVGAAPQSCAVANGLRMRNKHLQLAAELCAPPPTPAVKCARK